MNLILLKNTLSLVRKGVMTAFMVVTALHAYAQSTVSGTITAGEDSTPLPGVNILVKGTLQGTISDADGRYSIQVGDSQNDVLVFSFVGYVSQEVALGGRTTVDVSLLTDAKELSEVVVTALGIERETRDLGYAVQAIDGDDLTKARETNIGNALAGKIAGVTVVGNPSGVGASSRITIRGER
ncbi:MAG TPA: carboxypeptidase-like regulatory domain-containing protein, partial [Ohtaekwangia sp.]|nr:carboxypeptidase-like regulatory domain-containing protein [Ohtaekwangia sp.]